MKAAALLLALLASPALAEPDRVSILIGSHHVNAKIDFEQTNPGVFFTWEGDTLDFSVGAYRNSFGRPSVSATFGLPVVEWDRGDISLLGGLAYYPEDGRTFALHVGDVVPIVGLSLRHDPFAIQIMPSDGYTTDAIISFMFTKSLHK